MKATDKVSYFTEENSTQIVTGYNKNAKDERLKEVMAVLIRDLHEAVKEIEPTQEEWLAAIQFLTAVGHQCDDWRQEFILLSSSSSIIGWTEATDRDCPCFCRKAINGDCR